MSKSAVDAIIAEAMDACALDQIAKLNTAHLSSDSSLPSDLESRFRKLKSFPTKTAAAAAAPSFTATRSLNLGKENNAPSPPPPPSEPIVPSSITGSDDKGTVSTSPVTPRSEKQIPIETQTEMKLGNGGRAGEEVKSKKPSFPDSDLGSGFSPIRKRDMSPRQSPIDRLGCCFFLSPKKTSTTPKSKGKDGNGREVFDMDRDEAELDELWDTRKLFGDIKEHQKKLKKALKEQEKVNREAAKLVRWSKQASDRMRVNADELLSDEDEDELSGTHFH